MWRGYLVCSNLVGLLFASCQDIKPGADVGGHADCMIMHNIIVKEEHDDSKYDQE
jgi:hypothetical protein